MNSAKLMYFTISGNFGNEIQKSIKKRVKSVKKETFMKKNENRENLVSKTADLLSKINCLAPKKDLVSDKEGNQIKIRIALSDRFRAVKSTSRVRELSAGFLL